MYPVPLSAVRSTLPMTRELKRNVCTVRHSMAFSPLQEALEADIVLGSGAPRDKTRVSSSASSNDSLIVALTTTRDHLTAIATHAYLEGVQVCSQRERREVERTVPTLLPPKVLVVTALLTNRAYFARIRLLNATTSRAGSYHLRRRTKRYHCAAGVNKGVKMSTTG